MVTATGVPAATVTVVGLTDVSGPLVRGIGEVTGVGGQRLGERAHRRDRNGPDGDTAPPVLMFSCRCAVTVPPMAQLYDTGNRRAEPPV